MDPDQLIMTSNNELLTLMSNSDQQALSPNGEHLPEAYGIKQELLNDGLTSGSSIQPSDNFVCNNNNGHMAKVKEECNNETKNKSKFSCPDCGKQYTRSSGLKRHIPIHSGEKAFVCSYCNKRFSRSDRLKTHVMIHTSERPHLCLICGKQFRESGKLTKHLLTHTNRRHECKMCCQVIKWSESMKLNIKSYVRENGFICEDCQNKLLNSEGREETLYFCMVCKGTFKTQSEFERHMVVHVKYEEGNEPNGHLMEDMSNNYVTIVGNDRYTSSTENIQHTSYDGQFANKSDMNWNSLTSNDCQLSTLSFDDKAVLKASYEQKTPIPNDDQISLTSKREELTQTSTDCKIAPASNHLTQVSNNEHPNKTLDDDQPTMLSNNEVLPMVSNSDHQTQNIGQKHQESNYKVSQQRNGVVCNTNNGKITKVNENKCKTLENKGSKRYLCPDCGKQYSSSSGLKRHTPIHTGIKVYDCSYCDKRFSRIDRLNAHLKIHSTEKVVCEICNACFKEVGKLTKHLLNHTLSSVDCKICNKEIQWSECMKSDIRSYIKENGFICSQCKEALVLAEGDEEGDKHFCKICKMFFTKRSGLEQHMLVHTEVKQLEKVAEKVAKEMVQGPRLLENDISSRPNITGITTEHIKEHTESCVLCKNKIDLTYDIVTKGLDGYICNTCNGNMTTFKEDTNSKLVKINGKFSCQVCKKQFTKYCSLKRHATIHTGVKAYICAYCNKRFSRHDRLRAHLMIHTSERPYLCEICFKRFRENGKLTKHLLTHTNDVHDCKMCCQEIHWSENMKSNIKSYVRENGFICEPCKKNMTNTEDVGSDKTVHSCKICQKIFTRLERHMQTHSKVKCFECPYCQKQFSRVDNLNKHITGHTGVQDHVCSHCGKRFDRLIKLKVHLYTHSGVRLHACSWCDQTFASKLSLEQHRQVHSNDHLYKCDICFKIFNCLDSLNSHMVNHEAVTNIKTVKRCDIDFKTNKQRITQRSSHAGYTKKSLCEKCGKLVSSKFMKTHLLIHARARPHICILCKAAFRDIISLQKHKLAHKRASSNSCHICQKLILGSITFLQRHMLIHSGERPYSCDTCRATFRQKSSLTVHMRRHLKS